MLSQQLDRAVEILALAGGIRPALQQAARGEAVDAFHGTAVQQPAVEVRGVGLVFRDRQRPQQRLGAVQVPGHDLAGVVHCVGRDRAGSAVLEDMQHRRQAGDVVGGHVGDRGEVAVSR
jgi:hypothetical protein